MYGVVVWSDPVPLAVPSVVEDVPLPGWVCRQVTRQKREESRVHDSGSETLTGPLEPSFVPFGFFCMTAVADLESLMSAGVIDTVRGEGGGRVYIGIGGAGSGCGCVVCVPCGEANVG